MKKVYNLIAKVLEVSLKKNRILKFKNVSIASIELYLHTCPGVIYIARLTDIYNFVIDTIRSNKKYGTPEIMSAIKTRRQKIMKMLHKYLMYNQSKIRDVYYIYVYGYGTYIYYDPQVNTIYLNRSDVPSKNQMTKYIQIERNYPKPKNRFSVDSFILDIKQYINTKYEFAFFRALDDDEIIAITIDKQTNRQFPIVVLRIILQYLNIS